MAVEDLVQFTAPTAAVQTKSVGEAITAADYLNLLQIMLEVLNHTHNYSDD